MRYYQKIFRILLLISVSLVLCLELFFIAGYVYLQRDSFSRQAESDLSSMREYADSRLSMNAQFSTLLRSSEYTDRLLQRTEPLSYNKLRLYKFVFSSSANQPNNYEKFAFSTLADDYVITGDGTCGVRFFCSQFNLPEAALGDVVRAFDERPNELAAFLAVAGPDGAPQYIHVRREKFGSSLPLYIFTLFREEQLFETARLSGGTFAIYRNGAPVAAVGEHSAESLGRLAAGGAGAGAAGSEIAAGAGATGAVGAAVTAGSGAGAAGSGVAAGAGAGAAGAGAGAANASGAGAAGAVGVAGAAGAAGAGAAPKGYVRLEAASGVGDYRYVYLARIPSLATPVVFWLLLSGAAMLAGDVLLMLVIAKKMYMPIRELVGAAGREADGQDEFSYIKKTILSLHGKLRTAELSERQYHAMLDDVYLRDLLEGRAAGEYAAPRAGARGDGGGEGTAFRPFPAPPAGAAHYVAVIRYNQADNADLDMSQDTAYFLKQNMDAFLADALRDLPFARIVDMRFDTQAVLFACRDVSAFAEALDESLLMVETEHGLSLAAAVSRAFSDARDAAAAYRQASWLLETGGASRGGQRVVSFQDERRGGPKSAYFPIGVENSLANALFQGKSGLWRSILRDVFAENRARGVAANFQQLSLMLTAATERLLDAAGLEAADIFGGEGASIYLEYRAAEDYDALCAKATLIFEAVAGKMLAAQDKLSPAAEANMVRYVEENYRRDISLYDLASHLNLSKNYVSSLFKNATGMNFKEYVSRVRYREARAIFDAKPGVKVKDVAATIGCSTDILIRLFLKYGGSTPKDYQRLAGAG
ncbi:MAG: helix-turn-helix domain-containing protein, partial [Clostridiales bacterium]|nr:helix-turn-helix domain-containing protein [Clostridiales bacterium]